MSDLLPPTLSEMLSEVMREISLRQFVYPRLIASHKLTQSKADRQIQVMEAVAEKLRSDPLASVPTLEGKIPLVLYFNTREDAEGFITEVKDALPGMSSYRLP